MSEHTKNRWQDRRRHDVHDGDGNHLLLLLEERQSDL